MVQQKWRSWLKQYRYVFLIVLVGIALLCLPAGADEKPVSQPIPEAADAQLNTKRGVVVTHTDVLAPMDPALGFGPDSYHGGDYSLWYTNIQENVQSRVDRYVSELDTGDR